jgi:TolB protein
MSSHSTAHPITTRQLPRLVPLAALVACAACTYTDVVVPGPDSAAAYDLLYEETDHVLNRTRLVVRNVHTRITSGVFGLALTGGMPATSPDGTRVVYVAPSANHSDYDYQDLWTVVRGGAPQRIPLGEGAEHSPALSPDGRRVAYIKTDWQGDGKLYVADVNGQNERLVTPAITYAPVVRYASPAWSPDGTRLLFSAGEPGRLHLWIANPDGSALQQITNTALSDIDGAWSPTGTVIAFTRTASPASSQIVLKNLVSGAERSFAFSFRSRFPAWSADGQRLAFVSNMEDNLDLELYTMRADGEGLVRHTFDDVRQQSPRWLRR